jgi:phage-related protein
MTKKKKTYLALQKVREFIDEQSEESRIEYLNLVDRLEDEGYLIEPFSKKLDSDLFEIRIRKGKQIRVFYFYHEDEYIFGVHAFVKKTQKTPKQEMKQAQKIISKIKRGEYNE